MPKKYDLVFPLGAACSCSLALRAAGLQLLSFPYDWVVPADTNDLPVRIDMFVNEFKHWFDKQDLVRGSGVSPRGAIMYRNVRTHHAFPHEFIVTDDFDQAYPAVAAKMQRRIERLTGLIARSKAVLIMRIDTPIQPEATSLETCRDAIDRLSALYPGVTFDICLLRLELGRRTAELVEEHPDERITVLTFDYKDYTQGMPDYSIDIPTVAGLLKARYAVRDYRTGAERAAVRKREQTAKYQSNGASNAFEYRMIKLRKRLTRILDFVRPRH